MLLLVTAALIPMVSGQTTGADDTEKVILVDVEVTNLADAKKCYSTAFDKKSVELNLSLDDPMNYLSDFVLEEDALEGPDCFFPEMKIIFREYTYVVSLYCTSVIKYANAKPYTPSNRVAKNDLQFTESVLDLLSDMRQKHFGRKMNEALAQKFVKNTPIADSESLDDSFLFKGDEEDSLEESEDSQLQNEAVDREGVFDENQDPDLEITETIDEGEN
jgi:hypothetical protein